MSDTEQTEAGRQPDADWVNVGPQERTASALLGSLLLAWGARRGRLIGTIAALGGAALLARGATGHCPGYATLRPTEEETRFARERGWSTAVVARESIVIDRPPEELYRFWRDETNLPRFMESLEHVEKLSDRSSRWTVLGPAGRRLHWVSTITEDRPSEFIAWRAEENADIRNAGWVEFRDLGSGTSTRVETFMAYEPPIGLAGHAIASLLGRDPASAMRRSLQRLKQVVESEMEQENKQPTGAEQY